MTAAYVDTSCLVAIAFGERGGAAMARRLQGFDEIVSANLLEAELRATFARERVPLARDYLSGILYVLPDRALGSEIQQALAAGYLRGADLWHLACALYVTGDPGELTFLTLDERQRDVADTLGFDM